MNTEIQFFCNDTFRSLSVHPAKPLLDVLREDIRLTGTKEGCREGDCGACTVLIGSSEADGVKYMAVNSCLLPAGEAHGKHIVTVEGLADKTLTPVQHHLVEEGGTQCGFCTPGFVMSMTGYFLNDETPSAEAGIEALDGNICRCTGYSGIKRAAEKAVGAFLSLPRGEKRHLDALIEGGFVPAYFRDIATKLRAIQTSTPTSSEGTSPVRVSGGTDLYVQKWDALPETGIELLSARARNASIAERNGEIIIGGGATVSMVLDSEPIKKYFPVIHEKLPLFGSLPIRNRATVAGNIVNASPIADMVNILLALGARLNLVNNTGGSRDLPLRDFYLGYKTLAKEPGELIEEIRVPVPAGEYYFHYEKVSRRTYLDIASVNSSAYFSMEKNLVKEARISAGGVAPIPKLLVKACEYLRGKEISAETMRGVLAAAETEIAPISDARGSAEYKRLLLGQLLTAHFLKLFPAIIREEDVI